MYIVGNPKHLEKFFSLSTSVCKSLQIIIDLQIAKECAQLRSAGAKKQVIINCYRNGANFMSEKKKKFVVCVRTFASLTMVLYQSSDRQLKLCVLEILAQTMYLVKMAMMFFKWCRNGAEKKWKAMKKGSGNQGICQKMHNQSDRENHHIGRIVHVILVHSVEELCKTSSTQQQAEEKGCDDEEDEEQNKNGKY
ncbi:hypothetical protein RFI_04303, partial [Reticulomyxa filosa]